MDKTPEEIKKGLECCAAEWAECEECTYCDGCVMRGGNENLDADALAYIIQLEETVAKQKEQYKRLLETASILSDAVDVLERDAER